MGRFDGPLRFSEEENVLFMVRTKGSGLMPLRNFGILIVRFSQSVHSNRDLNFNRLVLIYGLPNLTKKVNGFHFAAENLLLIIHAKSIYASAETK